jgi:deoxyribodipyrimidine photo-lyase
MTDCPMTAGPLILWFRRDLRLTDHPMLAAAVASGRPLIPVYILDNQGDALGAAAKFRLDLALAAFDARLQAVGSRLILRRGDAQSVLASLADETGAFGVSWQRLYDPAAKQRDTAVKAGLRAKGLQCNSFPGQLLFEPWTVETGSGGYYKVYTPFWRAVKTCDVSVPLAAPTQLLAPKVWPRSDDLSAWKLPAGVNRGAQILGKHQQVGEAAAFDRLDRFVAEPVWAYREDRDFPGLQNATSGLSENLTWGEIGPRSIWHAGQRAMQLGAPGAEHFLKELVWREYAYHLLHHAPQILDQNWREGWETFPWRGDNPDAELWRRGMTGEPLVDAAMREMYVTGKMHNRARMIVASYLCKHLLTDWRVGRDWFADCLTDWDPAANAMGWQWVAGCGPDASPYFRVFNPSGQAEKFDAEQVYRRRWVAELSRTPGPDALSYFDAIPKSWGYAPGRKYPLPMIDLKEGRLRALSAYSERNA